MGGLPTGTVSGLAVDRVSPMLMFAAMRDGVFRSEDGGARWTPSAGSPKHVAAVATDPKRSGEIYAATAKGRLFVSRDRGRTWEPVR